MSRRKTRLVLWQAGNTFCPICLLEFSREDATAKDGHASIEHVPPRKVGGPHILVLTCKNCNQEGGEWTDHATVELVKQEHAVDLRIRTRVYHMRAGLNRPARAEYLIEMSHPAILKPMYMWPALNQKATSLAHQQLRLTGYQRRKPEVGLLKAAYLSVFSLLGVEFAKAKALTNVRAQIQQPDADLYRNFCFAGEDVGREIYIMYTKETTCWAVAIDGYWVLLPSVDTDERSFPFDSLRNVLDMKKLAHVFRVDSRPRFPTIYKVPVELLPDAVQRGLGQVGSLGWDTSVEANGQAVDVVSVGRDQDSLWFLEYHQ